MTEDALLSPLPVLSQPEISAWGSLTMQPAAPAFWVRVPLAARSKTATASSLPEAT